MTKDRWSILFAARVKSMMDYNNITKKELVARSGLDRKTLDRYLRCEAVPNAIAVLNIAKALRCSVSYLTDFGERVEKGDSN